jgi:FKBP-type peptidyl-prolyl cis-trans isomerase FkpA
MSVSQVPLHPIAKGSMARLWLAIAALIAIAYGIAYFGAGQMRAVEVETVTAGSGPTIAEIDGVIIEYTGRTEDGTVFDTTDGRGPAPMLVGQVIPGFRDALLKMQKGGRYKIVIPGRLAYGANPPQGSPIGPNEDLSFDINVIDVAPGAALQVAAAQQQGQLPQGQ